MLVAHISITCLALLQNCSLAVVGKDADFVVYDDDAVQPFLDLIKDEQSDRPRGAAEDPADDADGGPAAPPAGEAMDVEEPPPQD